MKRNTKKTLLIGSASLLAVVLGVTVVSHSAANGGLFAYRAKALNYDSLSVTFNNQSEVISGSIQSTSCILGSRLSVSNLRVKAVLFNPSNPQFSEIARFSNDSANVYFEIDSNEQGVTRFQNLQSISFGYRNTSYSGNFKVMYSFDNSIWNSISVAAGTESQALSAGTHYVKVVNDNAYAFFTSFTLNYSCTDSPVPETYNISYSGFDPSEYELIDLEGIDTTSLTYGAAEGSEVSITPVLLSNYRLVNVFEANGNYIKDLSFTNGTISFTMPDHSVELALTTEIIPVLTSISIEGQTTSFTVGDTFVFGGTVTANYSNAPSRVVTPTSISSPDMSVAGSPTVTVSYTESGVTKSAEYTITVKESGSTPVLDYSLLNGTYNFDVPNSNNDIRYVFDGQGNGTAVVYNPNLDTERYLISFTYTCYTVTNVGSITIESSTNVSNHPNGYRLANPSDTSTWTNTSIAAITATSFSISLYSSSGGYHQLDPITLSK